MSDRICLVAGCQNPQQARGFCKTHHSTFRRAGQLKKLPILGAVERFWMYTEKNGPQECWPWIGRLRPSRAGEQGYGVLWVTDRHVRAHRFSYELHNGPIPDGLVIDHLCRNRACVNPAHLEPVTHHTNIIRGEGITAHYQRRNECSRGHTFDSVGRRGERRCSICYHAANLLYAERRKAKAVKRDDRS